MEELRLALNLLDAEEVFGIEDSVLCLVPFETAPASLSSLCWSSSLRLEGIRDWSGCEEEAI